MARVRKDDFGIRGVESAPALSDSVPVAGTGSLQGVPRLGGRMILGSCAALSIGASPAADSNELVRVQAGARRTRVGPHPPRNHRCPQQEDA